LKPSSMHIRSSGYFMPCARTAPPFHCAILFRCVPGRPRAYLGTTPAQSPIRPVLS
jgi:hypothetical protein